MATIVESRMHDYASDHVAFRQKLVIALYSCRRCLAIIWFAALCQVPVVASLSKSQLIASILKTVTNACTISLSMLIAFALQVHSRSEDDMRRCMRFASATGQRLAALSLWRLH